MSSPSGTSSGKLIDQEITIMETRKRKRMISNRESARRSRMRKQKQVDDLKTLVNQLRNENNQILTNVNVTAQLYLNVEAENCILRAQLSELTHRLNSLNDIFINLPSSFLETTNHYHQDTSNIMIGHDRDRDEFDFLNPSWNLLNPIHHHACLTSPDVLMY